MQQITCLQFEEASSEFNPKLCLYSDNEILIYAEGSFLLLESLKDDSTLPSFEFPVKIAQIYKIVCKSEQFLLVLLESDDNTISIIDLKTCKELNKFSLSFLSGNIQTIRQSTSLQQVHLLTDSNSLFLIDNFILFTRLTPELMKERYEAGQLFKEFTFTSKINDFFIIENEYLTVGEDHMISWWKIPNESESATNQISSSSASIMNYFSSAFSKPTNSQENEKKSKPKPKLITLKLSKYLNEPDRKIDKILLVSGSLALLEDSVHGRLLVLDTENALIIRIFKGYRDCSCKFDPKTANLSLWASNKSILEDWKAFPFGLNCITNSEFQNCSASFDQNGNNFFVYNPETFQLKLFK